MERKKRRPGWVRTFLALALLVIGVGIWTSIVTAVGDPPLLGEVGTLVIFAVVFVGFFSSKKSPAARNDGTPPRPNSPTVVRKTASWWRKRCAPDYPNLRFRMFSIGPWYYSGTGRTSSENGRGHCDILMRWNASPKFRSLRRTRRPSRCASPTASRQTSPTSTRLSHR